MMGDITKNFSFHEFECPCGCGKSRIKKTSVDRLQWLRDKRGKPIRLINGGGYRCEDYNTEIGATQTHATGQAFDLDINRMDLVDILFLSEKVGFTGFGVKNRGGKWQLHIDDLPAAEGRPRRWLWTY